MLGFFPKPEDDESFYSCISRYAEFRGINAVPGYPIRARASIGLPRKIPAFLRLLPPGSPLTASQIIWEHTAYPYFAAFLTALQRRNVLQMMGAETHLRQRLTVEVRRWLSEANKLRLCPECVEQDRRAFGFATWKTLHLLPGVFVCPAHHQALRVLSLTGSGLELIAVTDDVVSRARVQRVQNWALARDVAQMSQWLLRSRVTAPPAKVRERLIGFLQKRCFALHGTWSPKLLSAAVLAKYGNEVLAAFECGFDGGLATENSWLFALVSDEQLHPLQHLVLLSILKGSVAECFSLDESAQHSQVSRVPHYEASGSAMENPRIFKNGDILALLDACDKTRHPIRNRAIVLLAIDAGLMSCEIARARRSAVLDEDNLLGEEIVLAGKPRSHLEPRRIPMPKYGRLWRAISDLLDADTAALPHDALIVSERNCEYSDAASRQHKRLSKPMRASSIGYVFWKLCERAGLALDGGRTSRRKFVVMAERHMKDAGASLRDAQMLAGHRLITSTQRLIEADPEAQRRLMDDSFRVGARSDIPSI